MPILINTAKPGLVTTLTVLLNVGTSMASATQTESTMKTYEQDLAFLKQHSDVIELKHQDGDARLCLVPAWQGRVMTSAASADGASYGWLNYDLIETGVVPKDQRQGLDAHIYVFGGEESAGASFLRKDGSVWSTDKDGIILCLLACEIFAVTGKDPGEHYQELVAKFGNPVYERVDAPASREEKAKLATLSPEQVKAETLAGEPITAKLTHAPANGAAIGGLKVCTENGWFAARPSGTEDIYKIYAESFTGADHLKQIQAEAREIVNVALAQ